jgi:hypothetical protein
VGNRLRPDGSRGSMRRPVDGIGRRSRPYPRLPSVDGRVLCPYPLGRDPFEPAEPGRLGVADEAVPAASVAPPRAELAVVPVVVASDVAARAVEVPSHRHGSAS